MILGKAIEDDFKFNEWLYFALNMTKELLWPTRASVKGLGI